MDSRPDAQRLTRIQTQWSLLFQAHQGPVDGAASVRRELLLRYHGAAYRYLLGILRDSDAAEELAQDFAVRFLRGDFKRADPERGRFRDFLKTALRHLAINYWERQLREKNRGPRPLDEDHAPAAPDQSEHDPAFLEGWRNELFARTWEAMEEAQRRARTPYHSVLRFKTEHPEASAAEMAEQLGPNLGRTFTEAGLRQTLHRARQLFADLLIAEVARSLESPTPAELEQELIELGLLDYCKLALQRWQQHH